MTRKYTKRNSIPNANANAEAETNGANKYRKRITAKEMLQMASGKTFEIEKNPPMPMRSDQVILGQILEKIDRTVQVIGINQAFVMPANVKHSIQRHLKEKHHKMKFRFTGIPDNPDMMRIYRIS